MKLSDGVEWGLHSVTLLATLPPHRALPAARLAEYHGVPAAYLAKHLQALGRAGILESVRGPSGGYRLARPADRITVLDCIEAIDGRQSAFVCTEIRQRGPAGQSADHYRIPCGIHRVMDQADRAWRAKLAETSIADLLAGVLRDASPAALTAGAAWIQEVLS